ncbi:PadR family transcriptional regulator [Streptosporangium sp. NPDC048865]|uniref:PadR family transcriptional regulator n=1 Tax=Streptosporangium sp. NPDC048865 TaxID=3155766 RepID=UPI003441E9CD
MAGPTRVTAPTLDVLEALIEAHVRGGELHGWAIVKLTRRSGPTVYGVLDRLEEAGWIEGTWEERNPEVNRPRRRLYRLSDKGLTSARTLLTKRRAEASPQIEAHPLRSFLSRLLGESPQDAR